MRFILSLLLALWACTAIAQDADDDRSFITGLIEDAVSNDDMTVRLVNFEGALSSAATADAITIADPDGIWLRLDGLIIDWNRSALLRGRVEIETLSAERIELIRLPNTPDTTELPSAEATPFTLPDLPVSIEITEVIAAQIVLTEDLLGEPVTARFRGALSLIGGAADTQIFLERSDAKTGRFDIAASFDDDSRVLALQLLAEEGQDGIAARMLDLPDRPSLRLEVSGDAPLSDFVADIALATSGVDRVAGTVGLSGTDDKSFAVDLAGDLRPLLDNEYDPFFGESTILKVDGTSFATGELDLTDLTLAADQLELRGSASLDAQGWPEVIDLRGRLGSGDGAPVLLPINGEQTEVSGVTLDVQYDAGDDAAWTGTFDIDALERGGVFVDALTLDGTGTITPGAGDTTGQFTADLTYAATGIGLDDPALAQAIGDDINGTISLARVEDGPLTIRDLTLSGAGLTVDGNAVIAGPEDRFSTTAAMSVQADDFSRFAALTGLDISGAGLVRLDGDAQPFDGIFDLAVASQTTDLALGIAQLDPVLDGDTTASLQVKRDTTGTQLREIRLDNAALIATGNGQIGGGVAMANFDAQIYDLSLVDPSLSGPGTLRADLSTDQQGVITLDADLTAPSATVSAQGTAAPLDGGYELDGQANVNLDDLSTYSALAGQDIGGRMSVDLDGVYNTLSGIGDADLTARTQDIVAGDGTVGDAVGPTFAGTGTLRGQVTRDAQGVVTVDTEIETALVSADVKGTASPQGSGYAISGDGDFTATDLSPYSALAGRDLGGRASIDFDGAYNTTSGVGDASLTARTQDIRAGSDSVGQIVGPTFAGAGTLRADVARDAQGVVTLDTDFDTPLVSADVRGTASPLDGGYVLGGGGDVSIADLNAYSAAVGQDIGGILSVDLEGSFTTTTGEADAKLTARTQNLTAGSGALDRILAPSLSGDVTLQADVMRDVAGVVTLDTDVAAPGATVAIEGIAAPVDGGYALRGQGSANVDELSPYRDLVGQQIGGGVSIDVDGTFNTATGVADADVSAQTRDVRVGTDVVDSILAGLGRISANVGLSEDGRLRLDALDVAFPNLTVTGDVNTSGADTTANLSARLRDVGVLVSDFSGPLVADVTARQDASGWQVTGDATGPVNTNAQVSGRVETNGQLGLSVTGSAPLALANLYISPRQVSGLARFDLTIQGPPELNSVRGPITISDGRFVDPNLQQSLEGIAGTVELAGGTARLDIGAASTDGGTISVSGPVDLSAPYQAAIAVGIDGLVLRDPTLYRATTDGLIEVTGPLAGGAAITGGIDIGAAEVQVPSTGVSALGSLPEVTHLGVPTRVRETLGRADVGVTPQSETSAGASGPDYPIDVTVRAPSRIFIRGRGLEAELGGELRLTGSTSNIIPIGRFDLVRGRLNILNQRFDLNEGYAQLQGDFSPFLRLVATTEARTGTTISIIIEGTADDLEVSFESSPELPQDEVLAQLLFGRDLSSISPFQAVQLATAVGTLAGEGGGAVNQLREGLDLDNLDFVTDDEGNAAVQAGKYISERVYTDVTVSSNGTSEINLNFDIDDNFTARGSAGSDGETSVGIFFERDY